MAYYWDHQIFSSLTLSICLLHLALCRCPRYYSILIILLNICDVKCSNCWCFYPIGCNTFSGLSTYRNLKYRTRFLCLFTEDVLRLMNLGGSHGGFLLYLGIRVFFLVSLTFIYKEWIRLIMFFQFSLLFLFKPLILIFLYLITYFFNIFQFNQNYSFSSCWTDRK